MALRPPVTWFHGGVPGLEPGDLVLPPSKTGVLIMGEIPRHYDGSGWAASGYADVRGKDHPALVHIVDDLDNAMLFAAFWTICPWHEGTGTSTGSCRTLPRTSPRSRRSARRRG